MLFLIWSQSTVIPVYVIMSRQDITLIFAEVDFMASGPQVTELCNKQQWVLQRAKIGLRHTRPSVFPPKAHLWLGPNIMSSAAPLYKNNNRKVMLRRKNLESFARSFHNSIHSIQRDLPTFQMHYFFLGSHLEIYIFYFCIKWLKSWLGDA